MTSGPAGTTRRHRIDDGMRSRAIMGNQLLLGSVLLFAFGVIVTLGVVHRPSLLVIGLAIIFVATAVALLVPWDRLPSVAHAVIPALDFVAIGMLRESSDVGGLGLLWAFPAMWSAWSFGIAGTIISVGAISVTYWALNLASPEPMAAGVALLFPLTIGALAAITLTMARRAEAQRELLEGQSEALQRVVERTRTQEDLITGVLDAVDFGVVRFDRDGTVTVINETHARLQEIRGGGGEAVYASDGLTRIPPEVQPLARARRGETFEGELVWYGAPGAPDRCALHATARRIVDSRGRDAGGIFVARDATAEQLALRAREDLIASVSHELRTPLTSIVGYLELARDDESLAPATQRSLAIAERNAERLLELVADILAASAESRMGIDLRVEPEPADLSDLVQAAIESAQPRAAARDMTIDGSGIESAPARADVHRIRQVVDNLISNAIKYGNAGGRIEVGCTTDRDHAWIAVRDDGPGIAAQELPKLFDRFFRSESVRKGSTHGSGLGLAISRDIVRAHGGEITVRSTSGEGSTFVVRLPAVAAAGTVTP